MSAPGGSGPTEAVEHEVKLEADAGFVMPDLGGGDAGLTSVALTDQDLDAVYYDGPTGPLLHDGITVRRRTGEGTRWTVKLPADPAATVPVGGGLSRREIEVVTEDETVPDAVADLVAARLGSERLDAVAHVRSHRRRWQLTAPDGAPAAEVVDDTVTADVPGVAGTVSFREIEIEFDPVVGAAAVNAVVSVLVGAGARPGDPRSKLARSLALLGRR